MRAVKQLRNVLGIGVVHGPAAVKCLTLALILSLKKLTKAEELAHDFQADLLCALSNELCVSPGVIVGTAQQQVYADLFACVIERAPFGEAFFHAKAGLAKQFARALCIEALPEEK